MKKTRILGISILLSMLGLFAIPVEAQTTSTACGTAVVELGGLYDGVNVDMVQVDYGFWTSWSLAGTHFNSAVDLYDMSGGTHWVEVYAHSDNGEDSLLWVGIEVEVEACPVDSGNAVDMGCGLVWIFGHQDAVSYEVQNVWVDDTLWTDWWVEYWPVRWNVVIYVNGVSAGVHSLAYEAVGRIAVIEGVTVSPCPATTTTVPPTTSTSTSVPATTTTTALPPLTSVPLATTTTTNLPPPTTTTIFTTPSVTTVASTTSSTFSTTMTVLPPSVATTTMATTITSLVPTTSLAPAPPPTVGSSSSTTSTSAPPVASLTSPIVPRPPNDDRSGLVLWGLVLVGAAIAGSGWMTARRWATYKTP